MKKPRLNFGYPIWFNSKGMKMMLVPDSKDDTVKIAATAAILSVQRMGPHEFIVNWQIVLCAPSDEKTTGSRRFSKEEVQMAFGLSDRTDHSSDELIERFGGTSASQGRFLRYQEFLNIPCPGTGHNGDPNISIELDGNIKEAIRRLTQD